MQRVRRWLQGRDGPHGVAQLSMSSIVNIDVMARIKQAAEEKVAADPKLVRSLLMGGGAALGGAGIGSALTHWHDDVLRNQAKNVAFGAGMATGLAGPQIIDALHSAVHPAPQGPSE
jgi:hypothetical protein